MQPIYQPSVRNYNNVGTRNNGFQYRLVPLSFNLQQKGNDIKNMHIKNRDQYNIGDIVEGKCLYDNKIHFGNILQIIYDEKTNNPITVYILDKDTKQTLPLKYNTLYKVYKSELYNEKYNFDKTIQKYLNESFFDDDIFDQKDDINQDITNIGDQYYDYQIGDIYYEHNIPFAVCCGNRSQFKDKMPRFCLLEPNEDSVNWDRHESYNTLELIKEIPKVPRIKRNNIKIEEFPNVDENGFENTQIIKNKYNAAFFPAFCYCLDLGDDIYLPAIDELKCLYFNRNYIADYLEYDITRNLNVNNLYLWSSTQYTNNFSLYLYFNGHIGYDEKFDYLKIWPFLHIK